MTPERKTSNPLKLVCIRTWGCQMNVYDSRRMGDVLKQAGYVLTDQVADAELVILNTCHIREKAAEKVFSELGRLRQVKETRQADGKTALLAVTGCVAEAKGAELIRRAPQVDLVFGPQTYHRLPQMLTGLDKNGARVHTGQTVVDKFDFLPEELSPPGPTAFLAIQEGCDNYCSYCVVPYTRGREHSRSVSAILDEARRLVDLGAREITLLGQNVNAWHGMNQRGRSGTLGQLIHALAETCPDLARLRYTTSHPEDMDETLIAAHGGLSMLMPFLHLPVQSGSDRILTAMNRHYDRAGYLSVIDMLRKSRPDMTFGSDFIVGFPGETDEDFQATLELVRTVKFAQGYSFKYSARPGTPAAEMTNQISESIKSERLQILQKLLSEQQSAYNQSCVGVSMPVLFERNGNREGQMIGRTPYMQACHVTTPHVSPGDIRAVTISRALANSVAGTLDAPLLSVTS